VQEGFPHRVCFFCFETPILSNAAIASHDFLAFFRLDENKIKARLCREERLCKKVFRIMFASFVLKGRFFSNSAIKSHDF
jgi:hypothetical protein